ncbi:MAG: DUF1835 domain-containing protein [Chitinophagaceae bacterium]
MVHIVFNGSEIELMQKVIALDESLAGEVIQIKDDFAVGPLNNIDTEEGWQVRLEWWKNISEGSPYGNNLVGSFDDRVTVQEIKSRLQADANESVWIWMAQNQHDVTGYYWLMHQLKEFQGRIFVVYLNNLPFINEKGQLFYPSWLHEIQPKEFLKAKKLARPITTSEFEVDPDEWKKIADESATVRQLEGGKKIVGREASFYDNEIVKNATGEWQKATRVLSNTLHRMKIKTGDIFIMWRLKQLISEGKLEIMGDASKSWKEFDVRLAGAKQTEATQQEETTV